MAESVGTDPYSSSKQDFDAGGEGILTKPRKAWDTLWNTFYNHVNR